MTVERCWIVTSGLSRRSTSIFQRRSASNSRRLSFNIPTKLVGDIFFNEDRKENTVSEKKDQASVYENGKWNKKTALALIFQVMLQKIYEANDSIPRDQWVNRNTGFMT